MKKTIGDPKAKGPGDKDSKIDVDETGANPKPYPKTRTKTQDRHGQDITTIRDSTKAMLFQGKTKDVKTKKEIHEFKKDSVGYSNAAKYDSEQFNNNKAYKNAQAFAAKKK
jgi:hypothetical protein